jgi:hypothetical protein
VSFEATELFTNTIREGLGWSNNFWSNSAVSKKGPLKFGVILIFFHLEQMAKFQSKKNLFYRIFLTNNNHVICGERDFDPLGVHFPLWLKCRCIVHDAINSVDFMFT